MKAILVGTDHDLEAALDGQGVETIVIDGPATREGLTAAGVETADVLIVTDVAESTAIPIAREANPTVRIVVYSPDSMPEFVRGQVDLAVAPGVLEPDVVAEELVGAGA